MRHCTNRTPKLWTPTNRLHRANGNVEPRPHVFFATAPPHPFIHVRTHDALNIHVYHTKRIALNCVVCVTEWHFQNPFRIAYLKRAVTPCHRPVSKEAHCASATVEHTSELKGFTYLLRTRVGDAIVGVNRTHTRIHVRD